VLQSVAKTGRLVVAHEAVKTGGFGAELAAMVVEEGFDLLKAPVRRVAAPDCPVPYSPPLLNRFVPRAVDIIAAAAELCD
jgi:pyruvate dehydrogenase E1 component beta subunit